jgi:hypothetical protein
MGFPISYVSLCVASDRGIKLRGNTDKAAALGAEATGLLAWKIRTVSGDAIV